MGYRPITRQSQPSLVRAAMREAQGVMGAQKRHLFNLGGWCQGRLPGERDLRAKTGKMRKTEMKYGEGVLGGGDGLTKAWG